MNRISEETCSKIEKNRFGDNVKVMRGRIRFVLQNSLAKIQNFRRKQTDLNIPNAHNSCYDTIVGITQLCNILFWRTVTTKILENIQFYLSSVVFEHFSSRQENNEDPSNDSQQQQT